MFGARDRFFAELVVSRGYATHQQVRASLSVSTAVGAGMLARYLVAGRLISEETRVELEAECDAWRHVCTCGETFYTFVAAAPCPRCKEIVGAEGAPTNLDLGSVSAELATSDLIPEGEARLTKDRLGPYKIVGELGRGGMGVVYRALQEPIGRTVALKVLLEPKGKRRERFVREARAAARLEHPNIVRVHDVGEDEGVAYYSMAFLEGKPLDRMILEEGKLPVDRALGIIEPIARAVHHAHEHRLIHRDLKPGNILVTKDGTPVLIDFGLARAIDENEGRLTRSGVAIGTPHYMSPEQVRGVRKEIDERTDVWALGIIIFEVLAGERPFKGDTAAELYAAIQLTDAPRLRTQVPHAPAALEAVVAKALERVKENRYRSARELADELARIRKGEAPVVMAAGERLARAARRTKSRLRAAAVFLAGLVAIGALGVVVKVFLAKREHDLLVAKEAEERASVKKLAESLVLQARAKVAESAQRESAVDARVAAEAAVAAVSSLEERLAAKATTEGGRAEARAQAASDDAASALRAALVARARSALRGTWSDSLERAEEDLAEARAGALDDADLAALHAETLLRLERPADAEAALAKARSAHPEEPPLLLHAGEALVACGDAEKGLALVDRAFAIRSNDATYRAARARARLAAGRASGALEDALALGSGADAQLLAIEAWLALGREGDAQRVVRELAARQGADDPLVLRARALVAKAREDEESLVRIASKLLAKRPEDPDLLAERGRARIVLRDADAASDLRAAAEHALAPRRRVALRIELAQLEDATGRGADAARDIERALAAARSDRWARAAVHVASARRALMGLARPDAGVLAGTGLPDLAAAKDALDRATREDANGPGVAATRAWLAVAEHDAARALDLVAQAPRDALAASVELEARRLSGATDLDALEAVAATLERDAKDPAGALERRAVRDLRFSFHAGDGEAQLRVLESASRSASWAIALAPRRAVAAAIVGALVARAKPGERSRPLDLALEWDRESALVQLAAGIGAAASPQESATAARCIGRALELSPDDLGAEAVLVHFLAQLRLRAGDGPGASRDARRALELEPFDFSPLPLIAKAAELRGDAAGAKAARDLYALATEANPRQARELYDSVRDELQSLKGVATLEKAVALAPRETYLWRDLCFARFGTSDMVGAWRAWVKALELEPYDAQHDMEEQTFLSTRRLRQITDGADFEHEVATLLEREPRSVELAYLHAWTLYSRVPQGAADESPYDRAIADLDRALQVNRRFALAYALRGHIRALRGEVGTAREDLERAHEARSDRMPCVHAYLASLEATLGETDRAVKQLDYAVKEGWTDRERLLKLPGIAGLQDDPRVRSLLAKLPDAPVTGLTEGF